MGDLHLRIRLALASPSTGSDPDEPEGGHHRLRKTVTHKTTPVPEKKDVFGKIGNSLSKFFTGH